MSPAYGDDPDRFGFDETRSYITEYLGRLVPNSVVRRAVAVRVETNGAVYERGEPVEITVSFRNRLPLPIAVPTPERRLWGWSIDGELEASDERRYTRPAPSTFEFRPRETKRKTVVWNGRLERTGDREWVLPEPGDHEIVGFLATESRAPRDATTVTIR